MPVKAKLQNINKKKKPVINIYNFTIDMQIVHE